MQKLNIASINNQAFIKGMLRYWILGQKTIIEEFVYLHLLNECASVFIYIYDYTCLLRPDLEQSRVIGFSSEKGFVRLERPVQ